jgi:ribonuclease HII
MKSLIGIDEVGRGCWAGPLVAAAVEFDDDVEIVGLTDSKKLTAKRRAFLIHEIQAKAINIGVGWVFPKEINVLGLTETVRLAMQKAIDQINLNGQQVVIDGNYNYLPHIQNSTAVVKADGSLQAASAASVIAKVLRDEYMAQLALKYPDYGFEKHVGYGTLVHRQALEKYGVLTVHRLQYKPIKKILAMHQK